MEKNGGAIAARGAMVEWPLSISRAGGNGLIARCGFDDE